MKVGSDGRYPVVLIGSHRAAAAPPRCTPSGLMAVFGSKNAKNVRVWQALFLEFEYPRVADDAAEDPILGELLE